MDKNANPFLNPEWLGLQQQYVDALSSLNSAWSSNSDQYHNNQRPWNEALEHWRKSVETLLPGDGRALFDNVLNQTRVFYSIADDFTGLLREVAVTNPDSEDWRSVMASHLGKMKAQFDAYVSGGQRDQVPPFFQSAVLDSWKKAVGIMSVLPEEMADAAIQDGPGKIFERLMAMPGLGPTREFQAKLAEAALLWKEYQTKLYEYQSVFAELGKLALDRLEQKINELADNNGRITSLKQLYDLWVDANEEVFADFAFNDDYSRFYGELVNALMQYRSKFNQILDDMLGLMNMPNGAAMQTVYKRQKQMQDQLQQLQAELERVRKAAGRPVSRGGSGTRPKKASRKPS